jgi:hypothetical protein
MMDIVKNIKENDITVLIIPNNSYGDSLKNLVSDMSKIFNKICYISLNKPYKSLLKGFEQKGVTTKKLLFIDAVDKGFDSEGIVHVSSPKALTELNIAITKSLSNGLVDSILFDSLSTLLMYEEPATVIKFAHSIISSFRIKGIKTVLTCLEGDAKSELIKDLSMFVDKIMNCK